MNLITIKYQAGREVCPKCQGMIAYDGTMRDWLPLGFSATQIDGVTRNGFRGECMQCGCGIFAVKSTKIKSRRLPARTWGFIQA